MINEHHIFSLINATFILETSSIITQGDNEHVARLASASVFISYLRVYLCVTW